MSRFSWLLALAAVGIFSSSSKGEDWVGRRFRLIDPFLTESSGTGFSEPFGAEDLSGESVVPRIAEPMVFDLVRPMGEHKGAAEVNTLALFPMTRGGQRTRTTDPLGIVQISEDRHLIEWAPEYEVAIQDGLAIEFEFPFEGSTLEAYKFAMQYTLGTSADQTFIHGLQGIVEPTVDFENWNLVLLYLFGKRFDERWSTLGMIGGRTATGPGIEMDRTEFLLNYTVFRDIGPLATLGLESNFAQSFDGNASLLLTPQVHLELTDQIMVQSGVGIGFDRDETTPFYITRLIYSF